MSEFTQTILTGLIVNIFSGATIAVVTYILNRPPQSGRGVPGGGDRARADYPYVRVVSRLGRSRIRFGRSLPPRLKWGLVIAIVISSLAALVIVKLVELPPRVRSVYSDFSSCAPVNNYGVHWGIFNDNPYMGNSNVAVEVHRRFTGQGCYAVLAFYLGDKSTINPYTGTFSWFQPRPQPRDASRFNGLQFYAWHEGTLSKAVTVLIQLSPEQMINWYDGYFEYDITEHVSKTQRVPQIVVPFEKLQPSPQLKALGFRQSFDKSYQKRLYQIAIVIRGEKGVASSGRIAFDQVEFY
jgi:hypothetical protein